MVADILLFPLETILHRLHLQGTRTIIDSLDCGIEVTPIITSYGGLIDCIRTTVEEEGVSGLYKGFGALIMQYGLQILIIRTVKIILEQTTFGQNNDIPKLTLDEKASMSQSVSEGNINRAVNESQNPRLQYSRDYSSAHNTPLGEPKLRSRFSNYNNPDLLNQ
jgi:solute carrier family 25 protein 46